MSTLSFPYQPFVNAPTKSYTLKRVNGKKGVPNLTAISAKLMFDEYSQVFRVTLECEGFNDTLDAVCRFAFGQEGYDRFLKEAGFYMNRLRQLQGSVVPWFYGLYEGHLGDESATSIITS